VTRALVGIAQVLVAIGETERAEAIAHDLLDTAAGDLRTEHFAYHFLADCALIRGDPEAAGMRYRQSLRAALPLGDVVETSFEVQGVAMSEAGAGDPRLALILAGSVEALWESLGLSVSVGFWDALSSGTWLPRVHRSETSTTPYVPRGARSPSTTPSSSRCATTLGRRRLRAQGGETRSRASRLRWYAAAARYSRRCPPMS
jgi:hypothetical protein